MSRCFPFPPLGYEKKSRVDDTDLLTKEKNKEKKHKKDKKDKEKREGKDKKEKDRSKDKHKEKKDRKEKQKDRDKDRDRDENRTSDGKRIEGQRGFRAEQNFVPNNFQNSEIKDSKYVQELARRIRDEDRASGSQMVQDVPAVDQRAEIPRMAVESGVVSRSEEDKKVKTKYEEHRKINGQRNIIDSKGVEKLFIQNLSHLDQGRAQAITRPAEKKDPEEQMEGKEKSKHKDSDKKGDKSKSRDREKNRKSKEKDRDKEKKKEKAQERSAPSKEMLKLKESGPKLKETGKDSLDFRNAKPSDPLKLSSMKPSDPPTLSSIKPSYPSNLSSMKPSDPSNLSSMKPSDPLKSGSLKPTVPLNLSSMKPSDSLRLGSMSSASEGNLSKRKEHDMNGYLLASEIRPNKVSRPLSSPSSVVENGRKLEPCQTSVHFASEKQGPIINHRVDVKEHKVNGLIAGKQLSVCPTKPPTAKVPANGNREAPAKPPHPDAEYLSRILSVPKVEELPDLDDQEWLFSSKHLQKKPNIGSSVADETPQVWAETLQMESADIYALPYVIPY